MAEESAGTATEIPDKAILTNVAPDQTSLNGWSKASPKSQAGNLAEWNVIQHKDVPQDLCWA